MSTVMPSRRGLLAASAWSVPAIVVASSAPAFATSPGETKAPASCGSTEYVLNWGDSAWRAANGAAASTGAGVARGFKTPTLTTPINVQVTREFFGAVEAHGDAATGSNMQVSPSAVGGTTSKGLTIYQRYGSGKQGEGNKGGQTVTFNFLTPVKGLSFTITDIDGTSGQFHDRVSITGGPQVVHATRDEVIGSPGTKNYQVRQVSSTQGDGTPTLPLTSVTTDAVNNNTSNDGNVAVKFRSDVAINSFQITFWNGITGSLTARGQQAIYISNMSFTVDNC